MSRRVMSFSISKSASRRLSLLQVLVLIGGMTLILCGGCATTNDSDLPWNVPQPWEGSPNLPGMPQD